MRRATAVCLLWLGMCSGTPAAAQITAPGPPGPYVIDVRGAVSPIPQDAGFFPPRPAATNTPARGFGIEVGGHVYLKQFGPARLGLGVSALGVRGTASPVAPASGSTAVAAAATAPDVDATLVVLAPQLSLNFGSADGWSYVSAGVGRAQVTTGTSVFGGGGSGAAETPARSVDSGTRSTANVGAGARWLAKEHLGFSFDVRLHVVSAGAAEGTAEGTATPRTMLVVASAGISLR